MPMDWARPGDVLGVLHEHPRISTEGGHRGSAPPETLPVPVTNDTAFARPTCRRSFNSPAPPSSPSAVALSPISSALSRRPRPAPHRPPASSLPRLCLPTVLDCDLAGSILARPVTDHLVILVGDDTIDRQPVEVGLRRGPIPRPDPIRSIRSHTAWRDGHDSNALPGRSAHPAAARRGGGVGG